MSRIYYNEMQDTDEVLAAGRFEARKKAVLNGRPAQKHFHELEAALLALEDKRLLSSMVCDQDGSVCAIGAYALYKGIPIKEMQDKWWHTFMDSVPCYDEPDANDVADWASAKLGITETLAWLIQEANDEEFDRCTPEERWEKMLGWVRSHIRQDAAVLMGNERGGAR